MMVLGDARQLPLADESVDCIVTSPPYNVGLDYHAVNDRMEWDDYLDLARRSTVEMMRVLVPGGRVWPNVSQTTNQLGDHGRETGRRRNLLEVWTRALDEAGLYFRDCVVWHKRIGNQSTAWGSHLSPNAPNLRGRWEPIALYFKGTWSRARDDGRNDVSAEDWPIFANNVWTITPDGRSRWHPAPFPVEIPRRAILLSTWPGDTVLDPFAGSGTTVRVAHQLGRKAIGVELSPRYVAAWHERGVQEVFA